MDNKVFSIRIVALDHYMAPPTPGLDVTFSSLEGIAVDLVPIVRVFGSTPAGQRVCLHLHQVCAYTALLQEQLLLEAPCMQQRCPWCSDLPGPLSLLHRRTPTSTCHMLMICPLSLLKVGHTTGAALPSGLPVRSKGTCMWQPMPLLTALHQVLQVEPLLLN